MIIAQWKNVVFWVGAVLIIVLASFFYQPAAAKTGSLLVWTRNRVYVMDIDTLTLERVAPATSDQLIAPSPGCFAQTEMPCWVVIGESIYEVDLSVAGVHQLQSNLPIDQGFRWDDSAAVSWSPDGVHLAYTIFDEQINQAELRVYNVGTGEVSLNVADVDPVVAVTWTSGCAMGLNAVDCMLAYKKMPARADNEFLPSLVSLTPSTGNNRQWAVSSDPIFELRWSPEGTLLYSQPKRHFKSVEDHSPIYYIPPGAQLANISPDSRFTVYYQPFTLEGCQSEGEDERCLYLGVWLAPSGVTGNERSLVYSVDLSNAERADGLNFIPTWSPEGEAFVFFQEGQLIHYDLEKQEATIWFKPITGKLRTVPVFSPNEEAVAFVDNEGQGFSEYRLVVVNPKLQPVEHIIKTDNGFKILAWLPN